jgi:hypothetical protein
VAEPVDTQRTGHGKRDLLRLPYCAGRPKALKPIPEEGSQNQRFGASAPRKQKSRTSRHQHSQHIIPAKKVIPEAQYSVKSSKQSTKYSPVFDVFIQQQPQQPFLTTIARETCRLPFRYAKAAQPGAEPLLPAMGLSCPRSLNESAGFSDRETPSRSTWA